MRRWRACEGISQMQVAVTPLVDGSVLKRLGPVFEFAMYFFKGFVPALFMVDVVLMYKLPSETVDGIPIFLWRASLWRWWGILARGIGQAAGGCDEQFKFVATPLMAQWAVREVFHDDPREGLAVKLISRCIKRRHHVSDSQISVGTLQPPDPLQFHLGDGKFNDGFGGVVVLIGVGCGGGKRTASLPIGSKPM